MRRRLLGLVASLVLATFGTVVLVSYVQSAHDKAVAGEPTEPVLVVTSRVPKGTKAADLGDKVAVKDVAASAKVKGAVSSASALTGKVAATDLMPGEQVLAERFDTPQALGRAGVPKGLLEVTVQLAPERVLGGEIKPGDTVAVLSSFKPFDMPPPDDQPQQQSKKTPNSTHIILHKVLVTNVQLTNMTRNAKAEEKEKEKEEAAKDDDTAPEPAPAGQLLITLAMDAPSVERVVFTTEHGTLWLAAEPSDASEAGTKIQTRDTVYE